MPFQLALPSPPDSSSEQLVITQDGSVKSKSELDATDIVLRVIPLTTSTDNGTLTIGSRIVRCNNNQGFQFLFGFGSGVYGSYSPTGLTGGESLLSIADNTTTSACGGSAFSQLIVSGFSSNPGSSSLSSVTCNGVEYTGSASVFSYGSGLAMWTFGALFGFQSKGDNSNVSCSIVHN